MSPSAEQSPGGAESGGLAHLGQGTDVRSADDKVVEILKDEVEDERSPHCDVVEDGPVRRVQCHLDRNDDDEDGGHHTADQHVIRRRVALQRSSVVIGTCQEVK